jgi:hypothetical protein
MAAIPVAIVDLPDPPLGFSTTIRSMAPPEACKPDYALWPAAEILPVNIK